MRMISHSDLPSLLTYISVSFDENYAYECAAALVAVRSEFSFATLEYHENDEWARVVLEGVSIWLCQSYRDGRKPIESNIICEVEVQFFRTHDGEYNYFLYHSIITAILEVKELYKNFYCSNQKFNKEENKKQLVLPTIDIASTFRSNSCR